MRKKSFTIVILILFIASLTTYITMKDEERSRDDFEGNNQAFSADEKNNLDRELYDTVSKMSRTLKNIDSRLKKLETAEVASQVVSEENDEEEDYGPNTPEQLRIEREEAIQKTEIYDSAFDYESRDQEWAGKMETVIAEAINKQITDKTKVTDYSCKTSFCRIEATHEDEDSSYEFERIKTLIPGSFLIQKMHVQDDGTTGSIAYFIRKGYEKRNIIYQTLSDQT